MIKSLCSSLVAAATLVAGVIVAAAGAPSASAVTVQPFRESFEHGAVGSKPTAANTAYDQTIGDRGDGNGTIAVAFDAYGKRGHCARFTNTRVASTVFGFLGEQVGHQTNLYLRRYYKLDKWPVYRTSVLLFKYGGGGNGQLGGTHNGSFAFGGNGQNHTFTLVNNNTNTTRSAATVPLNSWFRVEVHLDFRSGAGVLTARLFFGGNVDGTNPNETIQGRLTGPYADYIEDGILTNPNVQVHVKVDEAANGAAWIGPIASAGVA